MKAFPSAAIGMAAMLLIAACDVLGTEPARGVEVTTNQPAYAVGQTITVQIRNRGRRDMYFSHCNHRIGFVVEGRRAGGWEDIMGVDGPQCQAIHESGETRLRPGEDYTGTFSMDRPGTFRVRVLSGPESTAIGYSIVYSDSFEVTE